MIKRMKTMLFVSMICSGLILSGCGGAKPAESPQPPSAPAKSTTTSSPPTEWKSDGVITEGEYTKQQRMGEMEVFTRMNGDSVMMALKGKTQGYLSLGIDPEDKMKNSDIIMCSVKEGKVSVVEMFSTGPVGPHPAKAGGTPNLTMLSSSYKDGVLVVEFTRKLNPGGPQDKPLKLGENKVMWATGETDNVAQKHSQRGYGVLTLP